jgi:hypothetical protein
MEILVSDKNWKILQKLALDLNISELDVLAKGVQLLQLYYYLKEKNGRVLIQDKDEKVEELIID